MNEEVELYIEDAKEKMQSAVEHLENELVKVRAGRANPKILEQVSVDYYGTNTAVPQVANVSTSDARTIVIQPWEKNMIEPIERAIMKANLGFNPINNGEVIRINIPALTEERRRDLVKQVKGEGENAKVSVRNARRDANEEIKKMQKDGLSEDQAKDAELEIQKETDGYSKRIDDVISSKEVEIMKV